MVRRVAVVGGGLAGLCATLELARRGCEITVFEAEEGLGGWSGMQPAGWAHDGRPHPWVPRGPLDRFLRRNIKLRLRPDRYRPSLWQALPESSAPRSLRARWARGQEDVEPIRWRQHLIGLGAPAHPSQVKAQAHHLPRPPAHGWPAVSAALIMASQHLDVIWKTDWKVDVLRTDEAGKVRGVGRGNRTIAFDEVVLAVPPSEKVRLLESAGLDATIQTEATQISRLVFAGDPLRPRDYLAWESDEAWAAGFTTVAGERAAHDADLSDAILATVAHRGIELEPLLEATIPGWADFLHLAKTHEIEIATTSLAWDAYEAQGIRLVGDGVASEYAGPDRDAETASRLY